MCGKKTQRLEVRDACAHESCASSGGVKPATGWQPLSYYETLQIIGL